MNVQIFSDLHISMNNKIPNITPTADYLILAGDIGKLEDKNFINFMKYVNSKWKKVIYILGNHETYHKKYTIYELIKLYKAFFKKFKNVVFLENDTYELEDYLIVGSTMWTDPSSIKPFHRPILFKSKKGPPEWNLKKYLKFRMEGVKFLFSIKTKKKVILVTHFPVINKWTFNKDHLKKNAKSYLSWMVNNFDITYLPFFKNLSVIISGHTHYSYDFNYKNVRFISNQLGYLYHGNALYKKNGHFKLNK